MKLVLLASVLAATVASLLSLPKMGEGSTSRRKLQDWGSRTKAASELSLVDECPPPKNNTAPWLPKYGLRKLPLKSLTILAK